MSRKPVSKRSLRLIPLGVLALAATTVGLIPNRGVAEAGGEQSGELHVTKECSNFTGLAGSYCTITSSNVPEIPADSTVYYSQALAVPPEGSVIPLDSNAVLYVANGDWAVGRCTLGSTFDGLCAFSDGTGELTGFHARINVACGATNCTWEGTYGFSRGPRNQ